MCCNESSVTSSSASMIKKKKPKKARRSRTKTRKPKFLSLTSLDLSSSEKTQKLNDIPSSTSSSAAADDNQEQLNLFPLHPENLVDDKDINQDENMAYLFSSADGSASTLTGLLGSTSATRTSGEDDKTDTQQSGGGAELSPSSRYAYKSEVKDSVELVRTALRNKERNSSEEMYVRYSEVVERREEEVCSSAAVDFRFENRRLSLKLDYKEILNAWSDKGPLFVLAESPQIVPDIHDDFLAHETYALTDHGWGSHGLLWTVPELTGNNGNNVAGIKNEEELQGQPVAVAGAEEYWKVGQREASVLRYKEKRQNRLFAKRIRYQVRKLNAEKRPRVKGRFVKRS